MICLKCKKESKRSKIYKNAYATKTLMYCQPFYDENGRYHNHDRNTTTYNYRCSNGHKWIEIGRGNCWCGWSAGSSDIHYSNFELDDC